MANFNPLNAIKDINLNPLNLNLNPLNVDFQGHRDRIVNFFQHGTDDLNQRMQSVVTNIRSNDYKKKMHKVLTKIKDTKEYKATSMADYDVIFESVDMYSNLQSDPTLDRDDIVLDKNIKTWKMRFHHWLKKERISTLLFIPILGITIALMGMACDMALKELDALRRYLLPAVHTGVKYNLYDALIFVAYSVTLSFVSVSCISFISPYAVGSGIPEIKSILSGINLSRVLGVKTLVSKLLGMVCATAAGLTIGRTGPFMHASAIIAQQMMGLRFFSNIKKNQIVRYQMFICALASGVVANFGAPIGGLLFAIEVTATNCIFGNLWKGFLCATTTAIIFYLSRPLVGIEAFSSLYHFNYNPTPYGYPELISFVIIGIITGLIGALFVFLYEKIVRFRLRYAFLKQSRIGLVVVVSALSAALTYMAGPLARQPFSYCMKQFINEEEPVPYLFPVGDGHPYENRFYNLLVYIGVKLFLTVFNITIPIPGGAITPFIVSGAALGRLFGELLHYHLNLSAILPAGYAVIGSAGLVSGTIRALSPSIFVLELTGQLSLLIPVLICSITATAVGNFFNKPLFDTALKIQGLPFLSSYRSERVYSMTAKEIMRSDINFLSMHSTVKQVLAFLEKYRYTFIPVVDTNKNMLLLGIVERSSMRELIETHIENVEDALSKIHSNGIIIDNTTIGQNNINNQEHDKLIDNSSILISHPTTNTDHNNNNNRNNNKRNQQDKQSLLSSQDDDDDDDEEEEENEEDYENVKLKQDDDDGDVGSSSSIDQDNIEMENLRRRHATDNQDINEIQQDNNNNNANNNNNNNNNGQQFITINDQVGVNGAEEEETSKYIAESVWADHMLGDIIESGETALLMDLAPSQIPDLTPMNKVFHLFTMLGLSFTYVTSMGKLVGVITKTDLISKEL
ncbi:chloride channel protein [Cavenderia fasciculata]|uniref:Chloride channel protein n=1 Tax=Cavenderia fasciculata TaxID=261658 RepID=F4PJB6_CACFS|nr:chloride channel protein [Cavenderia fasciculata]EGG24402.1 chloride channel protein [Cavenderia fasciculata]|eukprot:XP_004362253.1 chloride channel protein [Cavenderia fasciculata]